MLEHRNYAILTLQYSFLLVAIKIKDENNVFFLSAFHLTHPLEMPQEKWYYDILFILALPICPKRSLELHSVFY
jgi:hypothetical protein